MKVDNPKAFRFILQDEIYLLDDDRNAIASPPAKQNIGLVDAPIIAEPIIAYTAAETAESAKPASINPIVPPVQPPLKTPEPAFNYLGGNNKNFVILLNYPGEQFIPANHLIALESILKRKGLGLDDVALINVNSYMPLELAKLAAVFNPVKLLIMGSDSLPQGIGNLRLNQPVQGKKINVLYSFSFAEMMSSNDNKKTFWEQMKTL